LQLIGGKKFPIVINIDDIDMASLKIDGSNVCGIDAFECRCSISVSILLLTCASIALAMDLRKTLSNFQASDFTSKIDVS
jgi:hypothetical protein